MRRLLPLLALCLLAGCRAQNDTDCCPAPARTEEITVSAAVSLKDAFTELGRLYEARTGTRVRLNFGASGILQKQIEQAAPVDVFASAGERQVDALAAQNLILADTRHDFARNTLVLIEPGKSPGHAAADGQHSFAELLKPDVRKIAIGNPKTVPAGQYTEQALRSLKLWEQLQPKLVLAEDVRQVLDYVARGEVEAGVVYASDVAAGNDSIYVLARAPEETHDPILYPIAVVRESRRADAARQFVALVLSPEGQAVLTKYGFQSASPQV